MKEQKANEVKKVGRPHPKTAIVEEAKGYERTYDGFFEWTQDTFRDSPMFALRDYCELEKIRVESKSHLMSEVIGQAQRQFRSCVFDEVKEFLEDGYKVKVARAPSGMHSWTEKMIRRLGECDRIQSATTGKSLPKGSPRRESLSKVHIPTLDELPSLRKGDSK